MFRNPLARLTKKSSNRDVLGYDCLVSDDENDSLLGEPSLGIEPRGGQHEPEVDYNAAFGFECNWAEFDSDVEDEDETVIASNSSPKRRKSKRRRRSPHRQREAVQLVIQEPSPSPPRSPSFQERAAFERHLSQDAKLALHHSEEPDSPDHSSQSSSTFSAVASYFPQSRKGRSAAEQLASPTSPSSQETDSDTSCTVDTEEDSFTLPRIQRTIRFADEAGLPIHTVRLTEREEDYEDLDWTRIIVLLLSPKKRKFEFIHLSYNVAERTPLSDALQQFPSMATDPSLTNQKYVGLCRPSKNGQELINSLSLQDYVFEKDEILLAILAGMKAKQLVDMSAPLLANKTVLRMVKRKKRNGFAVQRVQQISEDANEPGSAKDSEGQTTQPCTPQESDAADESDMKNDETPREELADANDTQIAENSASSPLESDKGEPDTIEESEDMTPQIALPSTPQESDTINDNDSEMGKADREENFLDVSDTEIEETSTLDGENDAIEVTDIRKTVENSEDDTPQMLARSIPQEKDDISGDESITEDEETVVDALLPLINDENHVAGPVEDIPDDLGAVAGSSSDREAISGPKPQVINDCVPSDPLIDNAAPEVNMLDDSAQDVIEEVPVASKAGGVIASEVMSEDDIEEEMEEDVDMEVCVAIDTEAAPEDNDRVMDSASVRRITGGNWVSNECDEVGPVENVPDMITLAGSSTGDEATSELNAELANDSCVPSNPSSSDAVPGADHVEDVAPLEVEEVPEVSEGNDNVPSGERGNTASGEVEADAMEEIPDMTECSAANTDAIDEQKVDIPVDNTSGALSISTVKRIGGGSWVPKSDDAHGGGKGPEFDIEVDEVPNMDGAKDPRKMSRKNKEDKSRAVLIQILISFLLQIIGKRASRPKKSKKSQKMAESQNRAESKNKAESKSKTESQTMTVDSKHMAEI